jgi:hypothetical protein
MVSLRIEELLPVSTSGLFRTFACWVTLAYNVAMRQVTTLTDTLWKLCLREFLSAKTLSSGSKMRGSRCEQRRLTVDGVAEFLVM